VTGTWVGDPSWSVERPSIDGVKRKKNDAVEREVLKLVWIRCWVPLFGTTLRIFTVSCRSIGRKGKGGWGIWEAAVRLNEPKSTVSR